MADDIGAQRRVGIGGIKSRENGSVEADAGRKAGVEHGNGNRVIVCGCFPLRRSSGRNTGSGQKSGKVVNIIGFGKSDAAFVAKLRGEVEDVGPFGQKNTVNAKFRVGTDDCAASTGKEGVQVFDRSAGAKTNEHFAGHKAGTSVKRGFDAAGIAQRLHGIYEAFAKDANASKAGHCAEGAGFALPVEKVVVRRKHLIQGRFYIGSAPGAGDRLGDSGVGLYINTGGGKMFKQLQ